MTGKPQPSTGVALGKGLGMTRTAIFPREAQHTITGLRTFVQQLSSDDKVDSQVDDLCPRWYREYTSTASCLDGP